MAEVAKAVTSGGKAAAHTGAPWGWLLAALVWWAVCTVAALTQSSAPIYVPTLNSGWDWWRYPLERNPLRRLPEVASKLLAIAFTPDGQRGWAVGEAGTILSTHDGGAHWQAQVSSTTQALWLVVVDDDGRQARATGSDYTAIATQDGGQKWVTTGGASDYREQGRRARDWTLAHMLSDGRTGWAIREEGHVLMTTDGGQHWVQQTRGPIQPGDDLRPYRRLPAPWYWLSLLLLPPLLLQAWRRLNTPAQATEGVADMAATDAALTDAAQDKLDFWPLARGISRFLRNAATEPPLTLAVTGDWGTGKSSLMGLLCSDLRKNGYRPIWFNAWHHQKEEHLFAALLGALRAQAAPPVMTPGGLLFRLRLLWMRSAKHWLLAMVLCAGVVAVLTLHLKLDAAQEARLWQQVQHTLERLPGVAAEGKKPASTDTPAAPPPWAPLLAWLAVAGPALLALRKALTAFGADPAALLAGGLQGAKLAAAIEQNSFRMRFAEQFGEVARALPQRMVIVIDDLDRCRPEAVLEIMEAVNFVTSSGPCFVIFGMATERVQAALAIAFERIAKELVADDEATAAPADKDAAERDKRRRYAADYLHKLINIEIKVPVRQELEAYRLLSDEAGGAASPSAVSRPLRSMARWMHAQAPLLVVPVAVVVGILAGLAIQPSEEVIATPPTLAASAALPSAAIAATPINPAASSATTAAAPLLPGQTSHADRWLVAALALLGLLALAAGVLVAASRRHQEVRDSQDFRAALRTWAELVRLKRNTPRAIKRFGNRLRFFEMLQQGQDKDRSVLDGWWLRWRTWRQQRRRPQDGEGSDKPAPTAAASTQDGKRLATPQLVVLSALQEVFGDEWEIAVNQLRPSGDATGSGPLVVAQRLLDEHLLNFNTTWPPSLDELAVFRRLLAGVRAPGDMETLPMRSAEPRPLAAEASAEPAAEPSAEQSAEPAAEPAESNKPPSKKPAPRPQPKRK